MIRTKKKMYTSTYRVYARENYEYEFTHSLFEWDKREKKRSKIFIFDSRDIQTWYSLRARWVMSYNNNNNNNNVIFIKRLVLIVNRSD